MSGNRKEASQQVAQTTQKRAELLVDQIRRIYVKEFQRYGPKSVFKPVEVIVVADKDWGSQMTVFVDRESEYLERQLRKFFMKPLYNKVIEPYHRFLRRQGINTPDYRDLGENTQLIPEDRAQVFGWIRANLLAEVSEVANRIAGCYSQADNRIYVKESRLSADLIAHELAHAYTSQQWRDVEIILQFRGMHDLHKLNEGLAKHIEYRIVAQIPSAPGGGSLSGYHVELSGYGAEFDQAANEFISLSGGETAVYQAWFGGHIDIDSPYEMKSSAKIKVGLRGKAFQWPWQASAPEKAPGKPKPSAPRKSPSQKPSLLSPQGSRLLLRSRPSRTVAAFAGTLKQEEESNFVKTLGVQSSLRFLRRLQHGSDSSSLHNDPGSYSPGLEPRTYHALSPDTRRTVNDVVDRRFRQETGFAGLLDPKKPDYKPLIPIGLRARDPYLRDAGLATRSRPGPYKPGPISRAYHALPREAYGQVSAEADRLFQQETGVTRKLTNKPEDVLLRRKWFEARDTAMTNLGYAPGRALSHPFGVTRSRPTADPDSLERTLAGWRNLGKG